MNFSADGRFCTVKLRLLARPVIWNSAPSSDMSRSTFIPSFCARVVMGGSRMAASSWPVFMAASRVDCSPSWRIIHGGKPRGLFAELENNHLARINAHAPQRVTGGDVRSRTEAVDADPLAFEL